MFRPHSAMGNSQNKGQQHDNTRDMRVRKISAGQITSILVIIFIVLSKLSLRLS